MRVENPLISRRNFLRLAAGSLAISYLGFEHYMFRSAEERAKELAIFHHTIRMPNLDPKWNGSFIVHLTDLHTSDVGIDFMNPVVAAEYASELTEYLQMRGGHQGNTFILHGGDLVSAHTGAGVPTSLEAVQQTLESINNIPAQARFFVSGNHEYKHPQQQEIEQIIKAHQHDVLGDIGSDRYIRKSDSLPFDLLALPDYTIFGDTEFTDAFENSLRTELLSRNPNKPLVMLTHTMMYDTWNGGFLRKVLHNALLLGGHTHGGQQEANTPYQLLRQKYALYAYANYKSKYISGVHAVENGNIVSIGPGLGHSELHGTRTVVPGGVVIEIRS